MAIDAPDRSGPPPGTNPADRRPLYVLVVALVVVLLIAVLITVVSLVTRADHDTTGRPAAHTVTAPVAGRQQARLDLIGGVGALSVRSTDLGDQLYRISTPAGSGQVPQVSGQQDDVGLQLRSDGTGGSAGTVDVLLNSAVAWQVRIGGGANEARLDLRAGPVAGVDIASGVSTIELWLPKPHGTVAVQETGGASELTVHAPAGVPVRVSVPGGAGAVIVDGTNHSGVSGGSVFEPANWSATTDRYQLDAVGGVSLLRVDRS